jgi:hypothetical protein
LPTTKTRNARDTARRRALRDARWRERLTTLQQRRSLLEAAIKASGGLNANRFQRLAKVKLEIEALTRPHLIERKPPPPPPPARNWAMPDLANVHTHDLSRPVTFADVVAHYQPRPGPRWTSPYMRGDFGRF